MSLGEARHLAPGRVAIFLLHGVVPRHRHGVRNYTRKHIDLERFRGFLEDLAAQGEPVAMPRLVEAHEKGATLPDRAFAITFDDGFANNAAVAAPVLERMGIPATFYVTTGFVDANEASWIDRIEYAFEQSGPLTLDLPRIGPRTCATPGEKVALLDEIRRVVKRDAAIDPYAFADEVWRQAGVKAMRPDPDLDQKMTWAQVRALAHHRLFTVGGHGHTHRILEHLAPPALEEEVATSLRLLRRHARPDIEHYSYPEGLAHCYSDRVIGVLRRHGVACSPTAEDGTNASGTDLFRLKRIMVA